MSIFFFLLADDAHRDRFRYCTYKTQLSGWESSLGFSWVSALANNLAFHCFLLKHTLDIHIGMLLLETNLRGAPTIELHLAKHNATF
jgi:hypothetical protein